MNNQPEDAVRSRQPASTAIDGTTTTGDPTTTYTREWAVNIHVKETELDRSFGVLIFLGSVPGDPRQWYSTPSYAGEYTPYIAS